MAGPATRWAFTLAEVLITLGIIGVVAAMTMPSLIAHYQKKQTATQLKKAYAEISQAVEASKAVNGDISLWDFTLTSANFFETYLSSFIKLSKQTVGEAKKNGITYYQLSGKPETALTTVYDSGKIVTLASGAQLLFADVTVYTYDENRRRKGITVDLNGFKKPNKYGRDIFSFLITPDGVTYSRYNDTERNDVTRTRKQLLNGPSAYSYQCNKQGRGMWCAGVIMMDGWEIKDDYPW